MEIPLVDLKAQYESIKHEIDAAIAAVISDSAFIKGKYVEKFDEEFAAYVGAKYSVGCANGTDAIEIVLKALEIGPGDEVIVPANTWISTGEAVTSVGARVVFCDMHPDYYTIDPTKIEAKITKRTRAIIPVHFYGLPAEMDEILAIAEKHKLFVIEDTAQAHGAMYKGKRVGTFGIAATFSFFPGKNLGAYGDAGAIVTNDGALAKKCRLMGDHGRLGKADHAIEGRNSRLDGLQAAILSAKLPHLEAWTEARRLNASIYNNLLEKLDIKLPSLPQYSRHVCHLYVIQVGGRRDEVRDELAAKGIATGVHYPIALPYLKAYEYLQHTPTDFPVAYGAMNKILSLPMYPELSRDKIEYIVKTLGTIMTRRI